MAPGPPLCARSSRLGESTVAAQSKALCALVSTEGQSDEMRPRDAAPGEVGMDASGKRGAAAAATVVVAGAVNVATGMLTQHWTLAWWVATAVFVLVGAVLQVWLTLSDRRAVPLPTAASSAAGAARSVTVQGDLAGIISTGDNAINIQQKPAQ